MGTMNNNSQTKYVVFDIGNVLLKATHRKYLQQIYEKDTAEQLVSEVFHQPEFAEYEKGMYTNEELIDIYGKRFPSHIKEIKRTVNHWEELTTYMDESWEMLKELKEYKIPVYILSTMGKEWKEQIFDKFKDFELIDGSVFSYEVHSNKPDSKIYLALFEKYHLDPGEGIFIDDKKENIDKGIQLGMKGIVFTNIITVKTELFKELNLE